MATKQAAGTIHVAPDGAVLLLKRAGVEGVDNYVGHWALPGGGVDDGENPMQAAHREAIEEMGFDGRGPLKLFDQVRTPNGMTFHTFVRPTRKFTPKLNHEHSDHAWANLDDLPEPMHPAVKKALAKAPHGRELYDWANSDEDLAQDGVHSACGGRGCAGCGGSGISPMEYRSIPGHSTGAMDEDVFAALAAEIEAQRGPELAFDRAPDGLRRGFSIEMAFDRDSSQGQRTDDFERLHAKRVPITKAGVNPYYGHEIPKGRKLGLEPMKVYRLLRHPDEIRKGAATSHNVPLLSKHVPHSADEHRGDITVGTVGSEAEYEHPYLYNSLAVWSRDGRDYVDNKQKELSSAYSYDADMTPGTYEGEPYDGVMRNMKWNHVCLVKKGRAGSDVALDEALKPQQENYTMAIKSMKATVAYGALRAYLQPKLAMDAAMPNIGKALATFPPGKFKESTPGFVSALKKALGNTKLAQDADLAGVVDGVQKLMASIDGDKTVEDAAIEPDANGTDDMMMSGEDDTSMDGGMEAVAAYLKSKGVPDDVIAGMPGMGAEGEDESPEEKLAKIKAAGGAKDKDTVEMEDGPDGKEKFDKGAMDAALRAVETNTIARMNAIAAAKEHVKPIVGELSMAFDSAEGVYRKAFAMQERDVSAIKGPGAAVALRSMWDLLPAPGSRSAPAIAQDSASVSDYAKMFPSAAAVKRA